MPAPMLETDDIEVLRTQFAAWMQGVNARFLGIMESECPHPSRTAAGDAWENGWGVVNQRLKGVQQAGPRTDRQVVQQTEELAREFLKIDGWRASPEVVGFKTYESDSIRAQKAWKLACLAQEIITNTDVRDAVINITG